MLIRAFIAALLFGGAACADQDYLDQADPVTDPTTKPPATNPTEQLSETQTEETAAAAASAVCEIPLDADPGDPCNLACDPEGLLETYVPEGTCIQFECKLTDGTPIRVGGCNF